MSSFGATLFERMLAKQQADTEYQRQMEQVNYQRDQQLQQNMLARQQFEEQQKQNDFDRQAKLAELQGKFAGALGMPMPQGYGDSRLEETAGTGYLGGKVEQQRAAQAEALKQYIQSQINQRAYAGIQAKEGIAGANRDSRAALQEDQQAATLALQQYLEPGRNQRAAMNATASSQSDAYKNMISLLGLAQRNATAQAPKGDLGPILNPDQAQSSAALQQMLQQMIQAEIAKGGWQQGTKSSKRAMRGQPPPQNTNPPPPAGNATPTEDDFGDLRISK